ncbi:glycosyl transferase family 2 [Nocardioides albertanoniae]|uniref:Glycosyl transferase family 2 n=1 Tax=Nocardioides albertanoniae TaxID=1175486 RepID=A0A543A0P2_9ACTN|nr:glycosyltransferase [Nocardioides albertanoniae]TQL66168.1 glycosyl transferase family 2 [Nocardioides albertanoniae]
MGGFRRTKPRLSVVVPVYNVAEYVSDSLASILRQPLREISAIEVVVVDDGSTDGSTEIVAGIAAADPRVTLITQPNSGVSIARHAGIEAATGDLLTFVDPDDILPQDAWTSMVKSLRRTGSDFAVGSAERVTTLEDGEERRYVTPLMRRNHTRMRLRCRIEDAPLMLADVFVWNKIFRRSFWTDNAITFPQRTRYQDQVALTQAFLAAKRFDVLTDVVYDWRVRTDRSSATQKRAQIANLVERVNTKRQTIEMVAATGSEALMHTLRTEILPIDMWEHFRASVDPTTEDPDRYWSLLRDAVHELWYDAGVPFEETTVPRGQRLMARLVSEDRRDDLADLIAMIDEQGPIKAIDAFCQESGFPVEF